MALIDLSMLIRPQWRWQVELGQVMEFDRGDPYRVTKLGTVMHAFTHIDSPLHIEEGREPIDQVPLDALCGPACLVDLTPVQPNQEIGVELLSSRWQGVEEGDIVLLKTCWDELRDPDTREYWLDAPYLSPEAAAWLARQPVKVVGYDFPQDYAIREIPDRHPSPKEMPTHDLVLRAGIYMIEYLCNLGAITRDRFEVYALPLKVQGSEGACARVAAKLD
jgi:arylformamidase